MWNSDLYDNHKSIFFLKINKIYKTSTEVKTRQKFFIVILYLFKKTIEYIFFVIAS